MSAAPRPASGRPNDAIGRGREVEHGVQFVGRQIDHVEEVPHDRRGVLDSAHRNAPCRMVSASSISCSLTVIGGANRSAVGVTALVTSPADSALV